MRSKSKQENLVQSRSKKNKPSQTVSFVLISSYFYVRNINCGIKKTNNTYVAYVCVEYICCGGGRVSGNVIYWFKCTFRHYRLNPDFLNIAWNYNPPFNILEFVTMEMVWVQNSAAWFILFFFFFPTERRWMMREKYFYFKLIGWPSSLPLSLGITLKISWK